MRGVPTFGLIIYANTIVCADLEKGGDEGSPPFLERIIYILEILKITTAPPTSIIPTLANTIITLIPPPTSS